MEILVTGASGFVGRNLTSHLTEKGHTVIKTDLRSGHLVGDIANGNFVLETLASQNFDSIVHLAAIADVKTCINDPHSCYRVNSFGTLNMLELAARKRVRRFIYSSSANVYGVPTELPVKETTPFAPRTPYDYSKVLSENLIQSYGRNKGLQFAILRSWKLFGEHDVPTTAEEVQPMRSYPSIDKIKRKLGYRPIVSLKEGLTRTIDYQKNLGAANQ